MGELRHVIHDAQHGPRVTSDTRSRQHETPATSSS